MLTRIRKILVPQVYKVRAALAVLTTYKCSIGGKDAIDLKLNFPSEKGSWAQTKKECIENAHKKITCQRISWDMKQVLASDKPE